MLYCLAAFVQLCCQGRGMYGTAGLPLNPPGANEWEDGRRQREESKGNTLIIALKESRTEELKRSGDGGRERERVEGACSNGVFVLVGVTHKASAGVAQLSYQTQRISKEECVCLCVCKNGGRFCNTIKPYMSPSSPNHKNCNTAFAHLTLLLLILFLSPS